MKTRVNKITKNLENDEIDQKVIFKYHCIDKFLYDILINSELWFSNPLSFNDPFDCNLKIDANNSLQEIKKYAKTNSWNKLKEADIEIKKLIQSDFNDKQSFKRILNSMSKQVVENLGLACFTETKDNLLMWAHYTQDYKGVVLEFDYSHDTEYFKPLKRVSYTGKYPVFNYLRNKNSYVSELLLQKSDHWKYEKEIRLIKNKPGLYPFNPSALRAIYFGVRTTDKQVETIKNLVTSFKKYKHVELFRTDLDETDYKLSFRKISLISLR